MSATMGGTMAFESDSLIGVGLYTVGDVHRLTGIATRRITRWLRGYEYRYGSGWRASPPVCERQFDDVDLTIGFLDLLEIRFIGAFLGEGISLQRIRVTVNEAAKLISNTHPLSSKQFKTDGRSIFIDVAEHTGEAWLMNLFSRQYQFRDFVWPSLYRGFEYSDSEQVSRWWPMYPRRQVVIDPRRAFGHPIVDRGRVPTAVLADAFESDGSITSVAKWYGLSKRAVSDAVEFEKSLAA